MMTNADCISVLESFLDMEESKEQWLANDDDFAEGDPKAYKEEQRSVEENIEALNRAILALKRVAKKGAAHRNNFGWDSLSKECREFDRKYKPSLYGSMVSLLGYHEYDDVDDFVRQYKDKYGEKRPWILGQDAILRELAQFAWDRCSLTNGSGL